MPTSSERVDPAKSFFGAVPERPEPKYELDKIEELARLASEDPGHLIAWQLSVTPENLLAALAAARWDDEYGSKDEA